jgi:Resolvase, N terminal domain
MTAISQGLKPMESTMRRAALYLRVSTADQTTANQERELREVAARMGCESSRFTRITASAEPRVVTSALRSIRCAGMQRSAGSSW